MSKSPGGRRSVAVFLGALAVAAAALAVWAWFTGGFRVYVLGVPLSVRGELRPAVLAVVLGLTSMHLTDAWRSRATLAALQFLRRTAPWIAAAVAIAVFVIAFRHLSSVAGGADASGYLSQAVLWLRGNLVVSLPDLVQAPWPLADWTFSPLGYRPRAGGDSLAPTYPPGLPLLMAAGTLVFGTCGPFLIAPLSAAVVVWATYVIGARLSGRGPALIAALAVAASPTVVFMMTQPMNDVPNAAAWTLSMLFAGRSLRRPSTRREPQGRPEPVWGRRDALLAGAMAGIAIVIRPNLAPLAVIPGLMTMFAARDLRGAAARGVLFAAGSLPFLILIGATFNHLYGSPLRSGYGSIDQYYALSNIASTVFLYPRWLFETQGVAAFAFLLAPIAAFVDGSAHRAHRLFYFVFAIAVFGGYVFYLVFDEWWYLRFLLPAFPFLFILGADAVGALASRIGPVARRVALLLFGAFVIFGGIVESAARDVHVHDGERRYADAAEYLQKTLPPGAVVLTMQHSGSVAYYSDRLAVRYDFIAPDWIDRAIEYFQGRGRPVYLLLDDWEIPVFAERFRGQRAAALVTSRPLAVTADERVSLFAAGGSQSDGTPARMPRTYGCVPPAKVLFSAK